MSPFSFRTLEYRSPSDYFRLLPKSASFSFYKENTIAQVLNSFGQNSLKCFRETNQRDSCRFPLALSRTLTRYKSFHSVVSTKTARDRASCQGAYFWPLQHDSSEHLADMNPLGAGVIWTAAPILCLSTNRSSHIERHTKAPRMAR